jgi:hypothetical protein
LIVFSPENVTALNQVPRIYNLYLAGLKMENSSRTSSRIRSSITSKNDRLVNNTKKPAAMKSDDGSNARSHFTRSRKPRSSTSRKIKKHQKESHLEKEDVVEDVELDISIDACATILAELDSRSYHRCLIQDASNITQKVLQPMSLPWTHKVKPVARNIPCDIDEMIDILTADDGLHTPYENGNFGFGQFETGRRIAGQSIVSLANSSESFRSATRRSSDPGIIDYSTTMLPSTSYPPEDFSVTGSSPLISSVEAHNSDDDLIKGDTLLRCFEATQALKKRKIEQARGCTKQFKISVKVNSSSSRSSIFTKNSLECQQDEDNIDELSPDLLEAVLPIEVENGRKLSKTKAKLATEELGSYNGPVPTSVGSGKNANSRTSVGRTRLIWTSNKGPSDQPQRAVVTSLITGHQIENGGHKRPRNIRLRIKVDDKICRREEVCSKDTLLNSGTKLQATLDCDELIRTLFDVKSDSINFPTSKDFVPPVIECVPDSSGPIHIVCTVPGIIKQSSVNPILKLAAVKRSIPCCMVCWRSTEGGLEVKECAGCGLQVHIQCCLDTGLEIQNEWKCSVCCQQDKDQSATMMIIKKSKRKSKPSSRLKDPQFESMSSPQRINNSTAIQNEIKCDICHLSGGAMSQIISDGEQIWIHETCRIWTGGERTSTHCTKNQLCALCGTNNTLSTASRFRRDIHPDQPLRKSCSSRCLVKCAAAGCHISVHPMCALVSSLSSQSIIESRQKEHGIQTENSLEKAKKRDIEICTQYTLTFASVRGSVSGVRCPVYLPVIFCGMHHPARERSFYGLYPGGKCMGIENTLKVPSCKEPEIIE